MEILFGIVSHKRPKQRQVFHSVQKWCRRLALDEILLPLSLIHWINKRAALETDAKYERQRMRALDIGWFQLFFPLNH